MIRLRLQLHAPPGIEWPVKGIAPDKKIARHKIVLPLKLQAGGNGRVIIDQLEPMTYSNGQVAVGGINEAAIQPEIILVVQTCLLEFGIIGRDPELVELCAQRKGKIGPPAEILQMLRPH